MVVNGGKVNRMETTTRSRKSQKERRMEINTVNNHSINHGTFNQHLHSTINDEKQNIRADAASGGISTE